jgi:hypothetical protein
MLCPNRSVVMPIYNEEDSLPSLYARLTAVLQQTSRSYDIIFVDDCCLFSLRLADDTPLSSHSYT